MSKEIKNEINVSDYVNKSYLEYALSVVKGRAIANIQDGLKPVHRRIFYSMYKMGISDTSTPVKSARVTGDVIGKYHPHGDQAVYEALVLQSQPFRIRYPIIEGIGNFGSRDGDGWAAARYTECKFHPIARSVFDELNEDAVNMIPNYDGKETEPEFMPSRLPVAILNPIEGIAVGMATNTPSHNLREVGKAVIAYLENENITLKEILEFIKGPDFPTGAQIISSSEEIYKVYNEGRGPFTMRAKYKIEHEGTKNWKIVFNEIPYGVSVKKVLEEIDDIFNPENKLKKDGKSKDKRISPEQSKLKQLCQSLINDYTDESDKENPLRLVITPKNHKQDPQEIISLLLGKTSLETNFNANFVYLGLDGKPSQKGLLSMIQEWSKFRLDTILRRCNFHINKINNRLHILEGRKIVLNHIDEVIQIIKVSNDPKSDLINKYQLTEIQAQDVLDLKLRQLGNLELSSIEKEFKELTTKKNELERIISSDKNLKKQMIKELNQDIDKYGDERKTEILEATKVDITKIQEKTTKVNIEDVSLAISEKGWIKVFKGIKLPEEMTFKEGDKMSYFYHCKNIDTIGIFDIEGKIYNYNILDIGKDGIPLNTLTQFNKISLVFPFNKNFKYLLSHNEGLGFVVTGENLMTKRKDGKELFRETQNKTIFNPIPFAITESIDEKYVAVITTENKFLTYKLSEVAEYPKGKGIVLCGLPDNQFIKEIALVKYEEALFEYTAKNGKTVEYLLKDEFKNYIKGRSSKGNFLPLKDKSIEVKFKIQS